MMSTYRKGFGLAVFAMLLGVAACDGGTVVQDGTLAPEPEPEPEPEQLPEILGAETFEDLNPDPAVIEVNLFAHYAEVQLEDGTMTQVMAYNNSVPGPVLHGRVGDRVIVHFYNQLSEPTTVHWHGLRISDQMDGNPRIMNPVEPGGEFTYDFVLPDAGTYWYHPHVNTIEQVERGLQGMIVVRANDEPKFSAERMLVVDDIRLTTKFQIAPFNGAHMDIMHGRNGNTLLTNGSVDGVNGTIPSGAIERWRIVNSANARTMSLSLEGAAWKVVGTDGGLLPEPYTTDRIELAVGHRFDLEVRPTGPAGSSVKVISNVLALDENDNVVELPIVIAEYTVSGEIKPTEPQYPTITLPTIVENPEDLAISLGGHVVDGEIVFTINGVHGDQLEDLVVPQGVPVKISLGNDIGPHHPFHLHGQFFQILTRNGVSVHEPGLKDTVLLNAQEKVEILTYFDNPGKWMYHCHIGGHAEHGMMATLVVTPSD